MTKMSTASALRRATHATILFLRSASFRTSVWSSGKRKSDVRKQLIYAKDFLTNHHHREARSIIAHSCRGGDDNNFNQSGHKTRSHCVCVAVPQAVGRIQKPTPRSLNLLRIIYIKCINKMSNGEIVSMYENINSEITQRM